MSSFWHNPDEAFFNVAQGIRQVVEGLTFGHAEAKSPGEVPLSLLLERDPLYAFPKPKRVRLFIQPRGNNTLAECAGACAISADETRFALCDGISASVLPRPWAALLARQWIKEPCYQFNLDSLYSWLEEPRKLWQDWVYRVWLPRANVSQEVAFNLVQQGAASTLLGVDLDEKTQSWKATAIGDTCLFILRNFNRQWHVESFPLTLLNDFKYAPSSITSRMSPRSPLLPNFRYQSGKYSQGDILMMATDALASWLFRQIERKVINWEDLIWLTDQGHFADFVDEQRRSGQLVDDDIMLIISSL